MPGNTTIEKVSTSFIASPFQENGVRDGVTNRRMYVAGFSSIRDQKAPWDGSMSRIFLRLSGAITQGTLTIRVFVNNTALTREMTHDSSDGLRQFLKFKTGRFPISKGDNIEIRYTTTADLLPADSLEAFVSVLLNQVGA